MTQLLFKALVVQRVQPITFLISRLLNNVLYVLR